MCYNECCCLHTLSLWVSAPEQPGHEFKHFSRQGGARAVMKDCLVLQNELTMSHLKGVHVVLHSFENLLLICMYLCEVINLLALG